jgi:superfamily II DNA/RNA helicase
MVDVYISHLGEKPLHNIEQPLVCRSGTLGDIFTRIESDYPNFLKLVLDTDEDKIKSSVLVFRNVEITGNGRWLESSDTSKIGDLDERVQAYENLLIAIFDPDRAMKLLTDTLTATDHRLHHAGGSNSYRAFMSGPDETFSGQPLWLRTSPEPLYPFCKGRPMGELVTEGVISLEQERLVPTRLRDAVADLWGLDPDFRLRLFQEEVLVHILRELRTPNAERRPLLLSIPTGGGKTEAFLIPLIANLYDQKRERQVGPHVRNLVIYPTRALANDQAKRITEILYTLNQGAIDDHKISIGVLTGDTPYSGNNLATERSLLQVCPACSSIITDFRTRELADGTRLNYARCSCGAEIDFFRLTRWDIINAPPDILITSPDMINRTLQSPRYHRVLFNESIEAAVFDEVHMYEGVFGCNVAHLLRRFEEACGKKPLYIGVSATIRNAKALASLIFDADLENVRYLRPARPGDPITDEKRPYLDYEAPPARYRRHYAVAPAQFKPRKFQKSITATRNFAGVLGHLIRDPHFRKTLIFANFRQDTDDIVRFLRDQESRYYVPYRDRVLPKLLSSLDATGSTTRAELSGAEVGIARAVDRWYRRGLDLGCLYRPPLEIGWHRGGLEKEERVKAVNRFAAARRLTASSAAGGDEWPIDVMVATRTLELGIDIGDVTTVINSSAPFSVNEYTQRIGRGGRQRDSLALTVVNPTNPLDAYFMRHFDRYVHATAEDFEDAPIIISNRDVLRSHLYARLLDRLAWYLDNNKDYLQAVDLKDFRVYVDGDYVSLEQDPEAFANALFDEILPPETVNRLQRWIEREAEAIPGVHPIDVDGDQLRTWWVEKIRRLHERICSSNADIAENDYVSGMRAADRDLVPDMRSAGPQTGLYLVREGSDDELRDTLSRSRAISSRPVGGFASQGSVTFRIEEIKDRDVDTESRIKEILARDTAGPDAVHYFHRMFGDENRESPFPDDPIEVLIKVDIRTPKDLSVKYHPYRFYCPRCGATYSTKRAGDERCAHCGGELRQLTEVYVCGGCGEVYLPPVPKVCLNPKCIAQAKHRRDGLPFTEAVKKIGKYDRHNDYFRFTALPRLKWQCRECGTEINYHAFYELPEPIKAQLNSTDRNWNTPAGIAKNFLYYPEAYYHKGYDNQWHRARFVCWDCKEADSYCKIHVTNIPNHHAVIHEYLIHGDAFSPPLEVPLGDWTFERVNVIALAREMYRRFFSYVDQETRIFPDPIFPETNSYLGNVYETHATFLRLSEAIDGFLQSNPLVEDYVRGDETICRGRSAAGAANEEDQDIEADDLTSPHPALLPWEIGRKPDPRRKWCDIVKGDVPNRVCEDDACEHCRLNAFDRHRYVRYLILHTLKHAIIHALPRFTGANKNQIRGYIYPNDQEIYDLALVDRIVGGSGCLYLLRSNWDAIWEMTGELLDAARQEQGQLLLPYTCSRYNRDLCAPLAFAFYAFLES